MVKSYLELNENEVKQVYEFTNRNKNRNSNNTLEKMDKELKDEIYNYGNGAIFMFQEEKIIE